MGGGLPSYPRTTNINANFYKCGSWTDDATHPDLHESTNRHLHRAISDPTGRPVMYQKGRTPQEEGGGTPPPPPGPPPLLPFQCLRLTAPILLRRLRCQEDLSFKILCPPSAGAIGGPWGGGGGSQPKPPPPLQIPPPSPVSGVSRLCFFPQSSYAFLPPPLLNPPPK